VHPLVVCFGEPLHPAVPRSAERELQYRASWLPSPNILPRVVSLPFFFAGSTILLQIFVSDSLVGSSGPPALQTLEIFAPLVGCGLKKTFRSAR
jgi:hypothetical protein